MAVEEEAGSGLPARAVLPSDLRDRHVHRRECIRMKYACLHPSISFALVDEIKSLSFVCIQTLWPFIDAMDKQGYISYRLFRDSTRYEHGVHFKVQTSHAANTLS